MTIEQRRALETRRKTVADLWLRCVTLADIARKLGVHRSQITRDLQKVRAEWKESRIASYDERVLDELARIDRLEETAWQGWDRSILDAGTRTVKIVKREGGERSESWEREEGQSGDPRYLAEVRHCIELRAKLLGLMVQRHEHSGPEGKPIQVETTRVQEMSDDELDREIERLRTRAAGRIPGEAAAEEGAGEAA